MPAPLLPPPWRAELRGWRITPVAAGMGAAAVFRLIRAGEAPRYLKRATGDDAAALREEIARTRWLAAQGMRVPPVLKVHDGAGLVCMLTAALPGASAQEDTRPAALVVPALARALAALHALPAAACPFDERLAVRLARAATHIAQGEIDGSDFAERNRGVAPAALLARLAAAQPAEDLVVVHGDASLDNMIVGADLAVGFIDCGRAGRADRYVDLAVAADGIAERFGARWRGVFARAYGMPWDRRKARYFSDLYELF